MFERDDDLMVDHMSRDCTKVNKTVQNCTNVLSYVQMQGQQC